MEFTFTPEQDALREQARAFLAANPEPSWKELAELGWTGVSIAEEDGGAGLTFVEEAVLFEELGRALYHGPYFSTVALALPALPADLRAEVATGGSSWTLALGPLVSDLDTADRVAIVGGDGIYELEGAEREVLASSDATRPLGVVRGGDPGRRLAESGVLEGIRSRMLAALAIEACGVARRALEYAIEHASTREQFGRKIGVYQAVSHPAGRCVHSARARPFALALGSVVRGPGEHRARRAGADRFSRREGVGRRSGRAGLRDGDPGARRDRLHVGARAASPVQARALDRELRRLGHDTSGRGRRIVARFRWTGVWLQPDPGVNHPRRLRWTA